MVGLDVGTHSIKVVQLQVRDGALSLLNLGMATLPGRASSEGRSPKPEVVAGVVLALVQNLALKGKEVAASVSGHEVISKKVELPMMTEDELENRMQFELGQFIPYSINEVDVDYQILDVVKDRPSFMEVLLVAAKKETVNDHSNLIRLCNLQPVVIDVDYFALSNAFEAIHGFEEKSIALIDIGASKAIMNIICQGNPVFTRGIAIGGWQITERIEEHFAIPLEDAERLKLGEIPPKVRLEELEEIFVSVVKNWVSECHRAINLFHTNFPEHRVEKICLSGGSCKIPGLDKVFGEHLGAEVRIFNPLAGLEYDPQLFDPAYLDQVGPQMAVAFGLALRKARER